MKHIFIILLLLSIPTISNSDSSHPSFWFCYQVGVIKEEMEGKSKKEQSKDIPTLVISNVFNDNLPNHYDDREIQFAEKVNEDTNGTFRGYFEPQCSDAGDATRAAKHRQKKIERAQKRNYMITLIQFVYKPQKD